MKQIACPIKFLNNGASDHYTTGGAIGAECSQVLKDLLSKTDLDITMLRQNGTLMTDEQVRLLRK